MTLGLSHLSLSRRSLLASSKPRAQPESLAKSRTQVRLAQAVPRGLGAHVENGKTTAVPLAHGDWAVQAQGRGVWHVRARDSSVHGA